MSKLLNLKSWRTDLNRRPADYKSTKRVGLFSETRLKRCAIFVILFALFAPYYTLAGDACRVTRFNTHYGYKHKIKPMKAPRFDECYGELNTKIVFDRVAVLPILGPDWYGGTMDRERIKVAPGSTTFAACSFAGGLHCWDIALEEFDQLEGKTAIAVDGEGGIIIAIRVEILIEE